jgi:DNA-binding NarL/FixJ family response regulator
MHQKWGAKAVEIGIVESDDSSRHYLAAVIGGTPGLWLSGSCATAKDAFVAFSHHRPRVLLVSLFLRDTAGTQFIRRSVTLWPSVLPILLIPNQCSRLVVEALEAGARAYLPKPCAADELVRAIWTVLNGGAVVSSTVARLIVDYFRARGSIISRLTDRERQVLTCLSAGLSQPAIAVKFGIDRLTVRTHVHNILAKLDAHSTAEAIALYLNPQLPALALSPPNLAALQTIS